MYKGTFDGNIDEIEFVKNFNKNKLLFKNYLTRFNHSENLWMIRVTTKQLSLLCGKKVFTRSDCYLANITDNIQHLLSQHDYYLSEEILENNSIKYNKISTSGISIKMTTSKSFQILKTGPNSFNSLFGSFELGAGASLFCQKEEELVKNPDLILGWKTTIKEMANFYKDLTNGNELFYLDQQTCKNIKNYACNKIKQIIDKSPDLQKKIFNGIGLYAEPYTAYYFYHGDSILELTTIPYNVTTGSGRSKGDYTIVLKP